MVNKTFEARCRVSTSMPRSSRNGNSHDGIDGAAPAIGSRLTDREKEVERLILDLYTNKEIARTLCISGKTLKNHRSSIFRKRGITEGKGVHELVLRSLQEGVIYLRPSVDGSTTSNWYIRVWAKGYLEKELARKPAELKAAQKYMEAKSFMPAKKKFLPFMGLTPIQVHFLAFYGKKHRFDESQLDRIMNMEGWKDAQSLLPHDLASPNKRNILKGELYYELYRMFRKAAENDNLRPDTQILLDYIDHIDSSRKSSAF